MSELNHELDRDNLNKEGSKSLGGLSFPSESEHYERNPNAPRITNCLTFRSTADRIAAIPPVKAGRAA